MASRDRTALFLRYREEAKTLYGSPHTFLDNDQLDRADKQQLLNDGHNPTDDSSHRSVSHRRSAQMRPDWVFTHSDLKGDLIEMEKMLSQLSSLYAKHLLPSFGDVDTSELEHHIRVRSHQLTDMLRSAEQKVRNITKQSKAKPLKRDVEGEILRNMQKRFASPLQQLSMSFRKKQKVYLEKLQDIKESLSVQSEPVQDTIITFDQTMDSYDPAVSEGQLLAVEGASALAQERTRELQRVVTNVNDLATLVKDLASLVVDQGTVLDRIDYNLEDSKVSTFGALRELRITDRNERKRHALCCIIIMSIACGVMFIILVYKWTS